MIKKILLTTVILLNATSDLTVLPEITKDNVAFKATTMPKTTFALSPLDFYPLQVNLYKLSNLKNVLKDCELGCLARFNISLFESNSWKFVTSTSIYKSYKNAYWSFAQTLNLQNISSSNSWSITSINSMLGKSSSLESFSTQLRLENTAGFMLGLGAIIPANTPAHVTAVRLLLGQSFSFTLPFLKKFSIRPILSVDLYSAQPAQSYKDRIRVGFELS